MGALEKIWKPGYGTVHTPRRRRQAREATNKQAGARAQTHEGCQDHPGASGISEVRRSEDSFSNYATRQTHKHTQRGTRGGEEGQEEARGGGEEEREGERREEEGSGWRWWGMEMVVGPWGGAVTLMPWGMAVGSGTSVAHAPEMCLGIRPPHDH